MTKEEFLKTLKWKKIPSGHLIDFTSFLPLENIKTDIPIVCKTSDGEVFVVGDCNFLGGVCDCCQQYDPKYVVEFALLWDEPNGR